MKKITVSILTTLLMLSMVFSSSVFAAEKEQSAWDSFLGLFSAKTAATSDVGVEYRGHVQNKGDFPLDGSWIQGPDQLGTVGESLRLEAFWIKLTNEVPAGLHIQYRVHVQNKGWMAPVEDGALAGTQGESLQIESVEIKLVDDAGNPAVGYSVEYRGHIQNKGDMPADGSWYKDGEQLGTVGEFLRLEALEVKIVQTKADMTAYNAAVAAAGALTEADYTADSWAALETALATVVTEDNTQAEVDAATAAINAAIDGLVKVTNVSSLTATGVKELKVTFNQPVDDTKATITVKKGSVTTNVSSVTWNTEKTEATLAMTSKLTEGTYKATVTGIDLGINNASVDVENEVATSIALLGNDAAVNTDLDEATVGYVVYNQYGEDITKTAPAIAWSQSKGTADDDNEGILTLTAATTFAVGDKVTVTGVISSLGVVLNQQVTIGDVATISEVTFEGVYNADDEVLQTDSTFTEFALLFEAKDQYGNVMTAAEINKALISSSKTTVLDFNAAAPNTVTANNGPDADQIGIVFKAPASPVAGTSTVRLISTATGKIFSYDVTVKEAPKVATLTLSKPDDLVAAGETVNIPFVAADQYGEEITSYTTLSGAVGTDITLTQSPVGGTFKFVNDVVNKKAVLQYTPATDGTKVLSASTTSGGYSQISIDVEEEAVPTVIVGVQDITKDLTVGGKSTFDYENVIVNDQYGRVIDMEDQLGAGATDFEIFGSSSTGNVTVTGDNPIDGTTDVVALNGITKGSAVITLALRTGTGTLIDNSEYTFTSKVTETTSSTEYLVDDLAVLYEGADATVDHVVPVVVKAVNGTTTIMPLDSYTVSVLDPASEVTVDPATQELTAQDGPAADAYYATGANTREVTVITTVNGVDGPVSITKTLTVSKEARKAVSLVLQDGTLVKESSELLSIDEDTINGLTEAEFIDALETNLLAKDQYTVAFTTDAYINSTVITNLPDGAAFETAGPVAGTFAADDTFKVTVITKSGITKVINIAVTEAP